jgi:hypothetical protein
VNSSNNNNIINNNNTNHHHTSYSNNNSNNSNRCSQNSLTESRILEMKRQEQRESYGRQLEEARMKRDSANFLSTSSSEHHLYTGPTMTLTEQNLLLSTTQDNSTTHGLDDHSFAGQPHQQEQTTPEKFELVIPGSKPNSFIGGGSRGGGAGEQNPNNTSHSTFVISSSSLSKNSALFKGLEGIGGGGSRAASVDSPDKRSATTSSIGEMFQKIISRGGATIYPQSPKHGNSREIMKQDDDNNDRDNEEQNLDRHNKKKDEKELLPQQQQREQHDNEEQQSETTEKINHAPSQGDHRDVASMKTLEMV